jgi:hypothetical protein
LHKKEGGGTFSHSPKFMRFEQMIFALNPNNIKVLVFVGQMILTLTVFLTHLFFA